MPELPEVEATVTYLRERIHERKVLTATVFWPRTIATHTPQEFSTHTTGAHISCITRYGKFIGIRFDSTPWHYLFIHLRMSGALDVIASKTAIAKHDRVILNLDDGKSLRFNDPRKFGRMYLCRTPKLITDKLGVDPLSQDFSPQTLFNIIKTSKARIKALLLDQKAIAGLGNIYVDESLWKAHIHPCTPSCCLTLKQCHELCDAIVSTLRQAIELSGTDFGDGVVHNGMYSPLVYARQETPCVRCSTPITKLRVQQRGTHICPHCQRIP